MVVASLVTSSLLQQILEVLRNNYKAIIAILLLIVTQMMMLIYTKKVTSIYPLPLLLCQIQFIISCIISFLLLLSIQFIQQQQKQQQQQQQQQPKQQQSIPSLSSSSSSSSSLLLSYLFYSKHRLINGGIIQLSCCWTIGFILFNASTTYISPSYTNLIRCCEPIATVLIGYIFFQKYYPFHVLITLLPIIGGVIIASIQSITITIPTLSLLSLSFPTLSSSSSRSSSGILFACLSNICFCIRPFFVQRMKSYSLIQEEKQKQQHDISNNNNKHHEEDQQQQQQQQQRQSSSSSSVLSPPAPPKDLKTFFNVTLIASFCILPIIVWIMEGQTIQEKFFNNFHHYHQKQQQQQQEQEEQQQLLLHSKFITNSIKSSIWFCLYQLIQLHVMSIVTPLEFSILTPIVKAFMIITCSIYFNDPFGIQQLIGIIITTCSGYLFTIRNKQYNTTTICTTTTNNNNQKTNNNNNYYYYNNNNNGMISTTNNNNNTSPRQRRRQRQQQQHPYLQNKKFSDIV